MGVEEEEKGGRREGEGIMRGNGRCRRGGEGKGEGR